MTDHNQDEPDDRKVSPVRLARRNNRRRLAVIGSSGAAAILVGGAYLATTMNDSPQNLPETTVMAPLNTASPADPDPAASMTAPAQASVTPSAGTTVAGEPGPDPTARGQALEPEKPDQKQAEPERDAGEVRREIEEARAKAAADGVELQRPLKQQAVAGGTVNERTVRIPDGSIRVFSAQDDLSGLREMQMAGDDGKAVGDGVNCTNRMRFAEGADAAPRPTVLLCWRLGEERSVVTMAVTPKGKPSTARSVEVIDKEWARLG